MTPHTETVALPVETETGETFGRSEKRVVEASLTLRYREPDPPKHIVTVRTRDGWTYRFQRFGTDEPLVQFDRTNPDGVRRTRRSGRLPRAVREFVEAREAREIRPDVEDRAQASQSAAQTSQTAVTDGGKDDDDEDGTVDCGRCERTVDRHLAARSGLCPLCEDQRRAEQARIEQNLSAHPTIDDPTPRHDYRQ